MADKELSLIRTLNYETMVVDETNLEKDVPGVVYIFYDKAKPGIIFYNETPAESQEGIFTAYTNEISDVSWDPEINSSTKKRVGNVVTVMVTYEQFCLIMEKIKQAKREKNMYVFIDTNSRIKNEEVSKSTNNSVNIDGNLKDKKTNLINLRDELKKLNEVDPLQYDEGMNYNNNPPKR